MHVALKIVAAAAVSAAVAAAGAGAWYIQTKQPVRSGTGELQRLRAPVSVATIATMHQIHALLNGPTTLRAGSGAPVSDLITIKATTTG